MGGFDDFFFVKTGLTQMELGVRVAGVLKPLATAKAALTVVDAGKDWHALRAEALTDDKVVGKLSKALDGPLVHLGIHDGELAFAALYASGRCLDAYCSHPDNLAPPRGKKWGGDPSIWARALGATALQASLKDAFSEQNPEAVVGAIMASLGVSVRATPNVPREDDEILFDLQSALRDGEAEFVGMVFDAYDLERPSKTSLNQALSAPSGEAAQQLLGAIREAEAAFKANSLVIPIGSAARTKTPRRGVASRV